MGCDECVCQKLLLMKKREGMSGRSVSSYLERSQYSFLFVWWRKGLSVWWWTMHAVLTQVNPGQGSERRGWANQGRSRVKLGEGWLACLLWWWDETRHERREILNISSPVRPEMMHPSQSVNQYDDEEEWTNGEDKDPGEEKVSVWQNRWRIETLARWNICYFTVLAAYLLQRRSCWA